MDQVQRAAPTQPSGSVLVAWHAVAGSGGGIKGSQAIRFSLRPPEAPERGEFRYGVLRPVDTEVGHRPGDVTHDNQSRRVDRAGLTAGTEASPEAPMRQ